MVAFLLAAILVWWHARADGIFYVTGLDEPLASQLGPLLPALSAGLTVSLVLSVVDAVTGPVAGVLAALLVLALPLFLPLHRTSLDGPPLAALTVMMIGIMVQAPRFSVAYGAIAAIGAVLVDPAGLGLPLAAIAWAAVVRRQRGEATWQRVALALLPLVALVLLAQWTGHAWPESGAIAWRGHLDEGLRSGGVIIGDQLAPTLGTGALRWFAIADVTLLVLAACAVAWRRLAASGDPASPRPRIFPALACTVVALVGGLSVRWLFLPASPPPGADAVFPIAVVVAMATVIAVAVLWPRWPRWGKAIAVLLILGWVQAALRA